LSTRDYLSELYDPARRLRSSERNNYIHVPFTTSAFAARAVSSSASRLWNDLPSHLTDDLSSAVHFKRNLKTRLYSAHSLSTTLIGLITPRALRSWRRRRWVPVYDINVILCIYYWRPTADRRATSHLAQFRKAISLQPVILRVWF